MGEKKLEREREVGGRVLEKGKVRVKNEREHTFLVFQKYARCSHDV